MKSLFNSIAICLLAIIPFTSCTEAVLEKSQVEAGWSKNPSNIPTVTLGTITLEGKGQDVVVTGSSVSTSGELLESGIAFSTVETFDPSLTKYIVADSEKISKVITTLAPATTYYVRAYGIVGEGSAYSEVQSVTTKDLPFTDKIQGTFSGTVVSGAYGDKYTSTLILELGEEPNSVLIWNIEPYWQSKGNDKSKGFNCVVGIADEATSTITVTNGSDMKLGDRTIKPFNAPTPEEASAYSDLVFELRDNGTTLYLTNGFYVITPDGKAEDQYNGGVKFTKK